jgi:hypothetical protein
LLKTVISLNRVNKLNFVTMNCCVFFEVRAEFLNMIWTIFGFKELIKHRDNFSSYLSIYRQETYV